MHLSVVYRGKGLVLFLCTQVWFFLCMFTGLVGCSVNPGISRGARKLTRTPRVIKKITNIFEIKLCSMLFLQIFSWLVTKCRSNVFLLNFLGFHTIEIVCRFKQPSLTWNNRSQACFNCILGYNKNQDWY